MVRFKFMRKYCQNFRQLLRILAIFVLVISSHSVTLAASTCEHLFSTSPIATRETQKPLFFQKLRGLLNVHDRYAIIDKVRTYFQKAGLTLSFPNIKYAVQRDPNFSTLLRASEKVRIQNAKHLSVNLKKFDTLTDNELYAQWGDRELNLNTTSSMKTLSPVRSLKRGDFIKLTRTLILTEENLRELIETRRVTSMALHLMNYDPVTLDALFTETLKMDLPNVLRYNRDHGGTAVSTTYAVDGFFHTTSDKLSLNQDGRFVIQLDFSVPAEAVVFRTGDYRLPEHVLKSPIGFAIVSPFKHTEGEAMFVNFVPPEWVTTNFADIANSFERIRISSVPNSHEN